MTVIRRIYLDLLQYLCKRELKRIADDYPMELFVQVSFVKNGEKVPNRPIRLLNPTRNRDGSMTYMADLNSHGAGGFAIIKIEESNVGDKAAAERS